MEIRSDCDVLRNDLRGGDTTPFIKEILVMFRPGGTGGDYVSGSDGYLCNILTVRRYGCTIGDSDGRYAYASVFGIVRYYRDLEFVQFILEYRGYRHVLQYALRSIRPTGEEICVLLGRLLWNRIDFNRTDCYGIVGYDDRRTHICGQCLLGHGAVCRLIDRNRNRICLGLSVSERRVFVLIGIESTIREIIRGIDDCRHRRLGSTQSELRCPDGYIPFLRCERYRIERCTFGETITPDINQIIWNYDTNQRRTLVEYGLPQ